MNSKSVFDSEAFNPPVPTADDVAALEKVKRFDTMSPNAYLDFLLSMTSSTPGPRETNSDSDEPFTLP